MKLQEKQKKQSGITLVALVVTIIILIILAMISIQMVVGEDGLIGKANFAKVEYRAATVDEEVMVWKTQREMATFSIGMKVQERDKLIDDQLSRGLLTPIEAEEAKTDGQVKIGSRVINYGEPSTVKEAKEHQYKFEDTTRLTDEKGNTVVIPGKFHIAEDSGETVQEGIVIEDGDRNQFVWIPVSNVDGDNDASNNHQDKDDLIVLNDENRVEITLGRYIFDSKWESNTWKGTGEARLVQRGSEYQEEKIVNNTYADFIENSIFREASGDGDSIDEFNATTKDLGSFIASVQKYHGYYIGRYEASYGSGTEFGVGTDHDYYKPLVQPSKATSFSMSITGSLWKSITQGNASEVSRNMYNSNDVESKYVKSDLVNSYAWDTAIVYIQAMGNTNYANTNRDINNVTLMNTGETEDQKCKIYDMGGNLAEWVTESSKYISKGVANPCVPRGGCFYYSNRYTAGRYSAPVLFKDNTIGFRPLVYIII